MRQRSAAFALAAVVVLIMGTTTAVQHVHDEDEHDEHCSICAICGTDDDACAPSPTSLPFAASVAPIGDLHRHSRRTSFHAYRARAPPLPL